MPVKQTAHIPDASVNICQKIFRKCLQSGFTSPNDDTQKTDFFFLKSASRLHLIQTSICFLLLLLPVPVPGYTITSLYMNTAHTTRVKTSPATQNEFLNWA